jgi:hypothetical protein
MKLFGFQQALQHLHYEQFAVFPRAAKMHELPENSFRLLRINGRATILAMIITVQPNSRSSGLTDLALCELVTSYFRNIDDDLPKEDARSDMAFKAETGGSANRLCTGPDTLSNSPLIRASPLTTKESRLPEPVSFLRRIHNRQPCGALDKATDKARGTTNHLVTKAS